MIEGIVTSLALKGGSRLLRAAVEDRDLNRTDASDIVTTILEAVVSGQQKVNADLQRIEQKLDRRATDPYRAAMTSGANLLRDAAPGHRKAEDRRRLLDGAQRAFSDAIGHAHDRPMDLARAHVMYGLTWLALGEPRDLNAATTTAVRILQHEALTSFQLMCQWQRDQERRRPSTSERIREVLVGPSVTHDWTASNRWRAAQIEHEGVRELHGQAHGHNPFPSLPLPHGSAYSHPTPGLPVGAWIFGSAQFLDAEVTLRRDRLTVTNRGSAPFRVAAITLAVNQDGVISPDVSSLDRDPRFVQTGETARITYAGDGKPAACLDFGTAEGVKLRALFYPDDPVTRIFGF